MPTPENRHNERGLGYELTYWCDGKASGRAGADVVSVLQLRPPWGHVPIAGFKLPDQKADLEKYCTALEGAHAEGRRDKSKEIRRVLAD